VISQRETRDFATHDTSFADPPTRTGNLAQIYGSYLFPSNDAPKYLKGFGVISGLCFTGVAAYLVLYIFLRKYPQRT
jgi:hypothetical protein